MLNVLIVDDDAASLNVVAKLVEQHTDLHLLGRCEHALEALELLQSHSIDVLFLDVEMPDMSGIELLRTLKELPQVVLISGNDRYAAEAFELEVVDFIVKPVTLSRFTQAVSRLLKASERLTPSEKPVFVKAEGRLIKLDLNNVSWIEAKGDYVLIRTLDKPIMTHTTLKSLESRLPTHQFARVHRSFIVNLDQVNDIDDTTLVVGDQVIPIGASFRSNLMRRVRLL